MPVSKRTREYAIAEIEDALTRLHGAMPVASPPWQVVDCLALAAAHERVRKAYSRLKIEVLLQEGNDDA